MGFSPKQPQLGLQSTHTFAFHSKGDKHKGPLIPQLPQNTNTPSPTSGQGSSWKQRTSIKTKQTNNPPKQQQQKPSQKTAQTIPPPPHCPLGNKLTGPDG